MKKIFVALTVFLFIFNAAAYPHCQIPCGIYDDNARFVRIAENITTIEKSMNNIIELSQEEKPVYNQIVRGVNNKDEHAEDIIEIATNYFLAQRVEPGEGNEMKLDLLHKMIYSSMKAKQTTELKYVAELRMILVDFQAAYIK